MNGQILLSQIEEVGSEIGEPDCKLINPYIVKQCSLTSTLNIEPWLSDFSLEKIYMISSDKILTITEPNKDLFSKYGELIK